MHKRRWCSKEPVAESAMPRKPARLFFGAFKAVLVALAGVILGCAGAYQFLAPELPDAASLRDVRTQLPLRVYSRDGRLIRRSASSGECR